jgi:3'-phosphoadenosine 5'-phosphosulfate sulfotransferase (PAPS reductase)/FAD synthetase
MHDIIDRHERIALQLSGGKDSLACLYLMKPHWDRLTVYWCNTGDAFPETLAQMERIRAEVPHFVEIAGRQPETIAAFGIPTDLLPVSATPMGIAGAGGGVAMQDRYSCCLRSFMLPMHERMIEDGITLIVRGQKNADRLKGPLRSGQVDGGIEYLFPVEDWSDRQVLDFLREQGVKVPRFYEILNTAPDCMTCSAWWEEGFAKYLKRYHGEAHKEVQARLDIIQQAVGVHIGHFNDEVNT